MGERAPANLDQRCIGAAFPQKTCDHRITRQRFGEHDRVWFRFRNQLIDEADGSTEIVEASVDRDC